MGETFTPDWENALCRARTHAPFLARALERQPEALPEEEAKVEAKPETPAAAPASSSDVMKH